MKPRMPARLAISAVTMVSLSFAGAITVSAAPPANDDFDTATIISALPFTDVVDTTEATTAADDPVPSCVIGSVQATVWYSLTPSNAMRIRMDTSGSNYYAVAVAYTGTRGALSEISCGLPLLTLDVTAGVTYSFMVFPLPGTPPGLLSINVQEIAPVTVSVAINATGLVNPTTGVATVSGTITCSPGAITLEGMPGPSTLQQLFAHRVVISGYFNFPVTACTGEAIAWSVTVTGTNGLFAPGAAQADVIVEACSFITGECVFGSADARIRLKASRS
jgi:hypothetical protein